KKTLQGEIMKESGGTVLFHRIYGVPVLKKILNIVMSAVSGAKASCAKLQNKNHPENLLFRSNIFMSKHSPEGINDNNF
ncbi:MAG: hypothetical protein NZ878_12475, partial [SAR324 cluster bacterium]|nr:hypothetical protein [SAR324 cluster bacterium]